MAIVKKGSRAIIVDGVRYRWRARHRPTYSQGVGDSNQSISVESWDAPGSNLVVELPDLHCSNWLRKPSTPVPPVKVAGYIREALAEGWTPTVSGKPFILQRDPKIVLWHAERLAARESSKAA